VFGTTCGPATLDAGGTRTRRAPLPMCGGAPAKHDYEYIRNGTINLLVAVEPKAGQRVVSVTVQRGKVDFVAFVGELLTGTYAKARHVHLVLDNLNTHFKLRSETCMLIYEPGL
jgi:hypothetical protein